MAAIDDESSLRLVQSKLKFCREKKKNLVILDDKKEYLLFMGENQIPKLKLIGEKLESNYHTWL